MAFKKPLHDVKTSAPLRSSDRRKLKQRVIETFALEAEAGDLFVPDPIFSFKFNTHLDEPGVAYTSSEGDPLWFTLGKVSNDLIPTVYTLWKRLSLLPTLTTPSAVIPVLIGGADLMIPGVVNHPSQVKRTNLVAVSQHVSDESILVPPVAVGRMAVDGSVIKENAKGKAVHILHTYEDCLWELGSKLEPPEPTRIAPIKPEIGGVTETLNLDALVMDDTTKPATENIVPDVSENVEYEPEPASSISQLSPQDVTSILKNSVVCAIHSQLSKLSPSAYPISSSTLYSTYILPSRPLASQDFATPVDIKHSTFKNFTAFLKWIEKDGLLKLKEFKGDLNIIGINASHRDVLSHKPYTTIADKEKQEEKKALIEKADKERIKEILVHELWKPHAQSIHFFEEIGKSTKDLYSHSDLRAIISEYATSRAIVNKREQQYIHPDALLLSVLVPPKSDESVPFIKREEAAKRLAGHMQQWHEMMVEGKDAIIRKGQLKPISVVVKIRQGRKASTLVTGFETFFITPEFLSDELKRICATSASVSPVPGKGSAMEVLVQGKQIKAVTELLSAQGVPKRWIEAVDISDKKK